MAISILLKTPEDAKGLSYAYRLRGRIRSELGDTDAAVADFAEAVRVNPKKYSSMPKWAISNGEFAWAMERCAKIAEAPENTESEKAEKLSCLASELKGMLPSNCGHQNGP